MACEKTAYSISEVAARLGVSRPTVYTLVNRADFPAFRIGSRWLISAAGLEKWVAEQAEGSKHI